MWQLINFNSNNAKSSPGDDVTFWIVIASDKVNFDSTFFVLLPILDLKIPLIWNVYSCDIVHI